ncbi:thioesterase II family protein [Puniceibacterium sp. IMCC21224]|uniref:thioesterase II family protein n=1 Tax=Puniceibacterium sp. IMCC21224 TaxID=1618204 RepID=UPI00065D7F3F|nr:alpha/beta fold hydrolase [Puniceibacterium sp. IMCC21224]KMK66292.1 putative thioesterase involved in non-ribosomal peptide biosynthesis [Puniceibacterium sp. IMCC21224]
MRDLICLPFAGGGTAFFHPWTNLPSPGLRIRPVCPPGREGRIKEAPFTRMGPLLDWLDEQLVPVLLRPHVLFGHSMGGMISYAWCLRRLQQNLPLPHVLVVSACIPPPVQRSVLMHTLDKPTLLARLRGYDPANLAFDIYPELWDLMEPVLRADFAVVETFEPAETPRLPIPVIALSGRDDPLIPAAAMAQWASRGSGFRHHFFDGGHFFPRNAPAKVLNTIASSILDLTGSVAAR